MGVFRRSRRYSPIGIDVREHVVHAAQFRSENGGYAVQAIGTQRIEQNTTSHEKGGTAVAAIKKLLSRGPFVGCRVVSAVPSEQVDIRPIQLSEGIMTKGRSQFREALSKEAKSYLLYEPEAAVLDFLPRRVNSEQDSRKAAGLLIAARKEDLNRHLALLRAAGLKCLHLDIGSCAVVRSLHKNEGVYAVIEIGDERTDISLACQTDLLFSRSVQLGTRAFVDAIVQELNIESSEACRLLRTCGIDAEAQVRSNLQNTVESGRIDAMAVAGALYEVVSVPIETLAREAKRSIDYFVAQGYGQTVDSILLAGQPLPANTEQYLAHTLSIPVECGDPLSGYSQAYAGTKQANSAIAVAAGLALREGT